MTLCLSLLPFIYLTPAGWLIGSVPIYTGWVAVSPTDWLSYRLTDSPDPTWWSIASAGALSSTDMNFKWNSSPVHNYHVPIHWPHWQWAMKIVVGYLPHDSPNTISGHISLLHRTIYCTLHTRPQEFTSVVHSTHHHPWPWVYSN